VDLIDLTQKFATHPETVGLISSDHSLGSREDIDTNTISGLFDIRRLDVDTLSRTANTTKRRNILCLADIFEFDRKRALIFGECVVNNLSVFFQNTKNLSAHLGKRNTHLVKTSEISVANTGKEICN